MRLFLNTFISQPIKNFIWLFLVSLKYKSGYIHSKSPKSFLNKKGIQINRNVKFGNWQVEIGDYCFIGDSTRIYNCDSIGSYSSISFSVSIGVENHSLTHISTSPYFYDKSKGWNESSEFFNKSTYVVIEPDVLISCNVTVLDNVKLGVGSVIGAGSIVTKDVPPYAIVGGVPAKVLKFRFDQEVIDMLLESKWWELPKEKIVSFSKFFNNPKLFSGKIIALNKDK